MGKIIAYKCEECGSTIFRLFTDGAQCAECNAEYGIEEITLGTEN